MVDLWYRIHGYGECSSPLHSIDAALPHDFSAMVVCRTSLVILSLNMELSMVAHTLKHLGEFNRSLEKVSLIYIVSSRPLRAT